MELTDEEIIKDLEQYNDEQTINNALDLIRRLQDGYSSASKASEEWREKYEKERKENAELQKQVDEVKTIGAWVDEIHENAVVHGWYDGNGIKNFGELLMLVVTEVAEAMEEYRNGMLMKETYVNEKGKMCGISFELADIVIRVMDICGYYDLDLEQAIAQKHEYNKSRPYKHGGKRC